MTQNSGEATIGLSGTTATALWAGRVMTGLFVLFMLFDVGIKLMRLPIVEDAMIQLGYPPAWAFRSSARGSAAGPLPDPTPISAVLLPACLAERDRQPADR
jgi:hypothetical protein